MIHFMRRAAPKNFEEFELKEGFDKIKSHYT